MNDSSPRPTEPLPAFVYALVDIGGQLTSILSHMLAHENPNAPESIPEVLRRLLTDIFRDELEADATALEAAATVLDGAAAAIEQNLFLVPRLQPSRPPRRRERR